jgi:uncharacterized protein YkwD
MRRFIAISAAATALLALAALPGAGLANASSMERLIAPASACPGSGNAGAAARVQEDAMLCMTNFARRHSGLRELAGAATLNRAARFKSGDIIRCDSFSHEACGRDFTFWMERVGYIPTPCWRAGENIAWGTGSYSTVRSIFASWMHSEGHRENILGSYGQIGIGLRVGGLDGYRGAHVWTQEFGLRC